jgi:hypothetical protein
MYVNGKIRPVETSKNGGRREVNENDGQGEFNYDIL